LAAKKKISILGCRGIPARHGGFETFAENLALHLVNRGWGVTVYCQLQQPDRPQELSNASSSGPIPARSLGSTNTHWNGVELVYLSEAVPGPLGTIIFDWRSVWHACRQDGLFLTLGYNTALFNVLFRFTRRRNIINMDGFEWKRGKWSYPARLWFYVNERIARLVGNHLIADHPEIETYLGSRLARKKKVTMIPYGAPEITQCDVAPIEQFEVEAARYALIVGRPQPDNTVLEMVRAFSKSNRHIKLLVLCDYIPEKNTYHNEIMAAASDDVLFVGHVGDHATLQALQFHCRLYLHGHQVGGTNPSLVEALGCGSAIIAHDNPFNRWVAGDSALYFQSETECENAIDRLLEDDVLQSNLRDVSRNRHAERFRWSQILEEYDELLDAEFDKI